MIMDIRFHFKSYTGIKYKRRDQCLIHQNVLQLTIFYLFFNDPGQI